MNHGHVHPNPDGSKARCGGPTICPQCAQEYARTQIGLKPLPDTTDFLAQSLRRPYPWRSEKPTQPGWYIYEGEPGSYHVLCIEERLPGRFIVNGPQIWEQPLAYFDGLWKGPLDLATL